MPAQSGSELHLSIGSTDEVEHAGACKFELALAKLLTVAMLLGFDQILGVNYFDLAIYFSQMSFQVTVLI